MQTLQPSKHNGRTNGQFVVNYAEYVPLEPKSELVDITPEIAQAWLGKAGEGHRTISGPKVNKITRDITSGEFLVTANGIGFNSDGRLIDGRHRLSAVIDAGLPIRSWVVFGLDPKAIDVTDDGRPRSQSDIFKMAKELHYTNLASLVSHVWRYERKMWTRSTMTPTKPEAKKWLLEHPECRESVVLGARAAPVMAPTVAAAAHYIFAKIDKAQADRFLEQLITGVGLGMDDPVRRLRERMLSDKMEKRKMTTVERFAITIKAWNTSRRGIPLKHLRWAREGRAREAFPVAV